MAWYKPWTWGDESDSQRQQRDQLQNQGGMSSWFGDSGQENYAAGTADINAEVDAMRRRARGEDSLSAEQLRQGMARQYSAQRSMAASANASNAPMAARTAMMNVGRANTAMAGQAAMAGIAERQAAQEALSRALLEKRQQDINVALGSRQNAISAYGGYKPEGSTLEKWGGAISGAAALYGRGK